MADAFSAASALHGLGGGILIGLAAALLLLGAGRIAGVSGILARASGIANEGMGRPSALAFLVGLPLGALILLCLGGTDRPELPPAGIMIAAGLMVGFGTRLGSGCTSGHGVCGMSRLSPRSLVATAVFIGAGIATVTVIRHLLGTGAAQ
ncbi:MAG: YeeE/YedE thiosulfate transporter family protein [Sphingomicrobium sp.]